MAGRETQFHGSGGLPRVNVEQFGRILTTFADITLLIDDQGVIAAIEVSPENRALGCLDHWRARNIRDFLAEESLEKFEARLAELASGKVDMIPAVELNHVDNANWEFPIRYMIHRASSDGSLLLTGRDMRHIAEVQEQLVRTQLALERDYEKYREFDTRYRVLLEASRDALILINGRSARIEDCNAEAAQILGISSEALAGASFTALFDTGRRGDLMELLANAIGTGRPRLTLSVPRTSRTVAVHPRQFRAAGETLILCRIDAEDGTAMAHEDLASSLAGFFDSAADGIVFTDASGRIHHSNDAFLSMGDLSAAREAEGRSLGEFLSRGGVDLKVLLENATRFGQMKLYATRLKPQFGSEFPVDVSTCRIGGEAGIRFGFVLRMAAGRELLRDGGGMPMRDDEARNAMDLVGTAPLKEIVAATTDVVERICIETAVELTNNNRVAAAEMLGLSRQSLYVKLRKYGILEREPAAGLPADSKLSARPED
ncbi:MAG: transcriptional regulator PpsR [Pseudomonadota bacterium]